MNDIVKESEMVVIPQQEQPTNLLAVIERAANSRDVDVDKMRALLDMQMEIRREEAKVAFIQALNRVQAEIQPILKKSQNQQTNSKYAKVAEVDRVLTPLYTKHGFSLSFGTADSIWADQGYIRIICDVSHEAGHIKTYHYDLPPDETGIKGTANKTKVHASASTLTYGQRYLKSLIFNLSFIDDTDGNVPDSPITEKQVADIQALMDEAIKNPAKFLLWLGIEKLSDLPSSKYDMAVKELEKRRAA